VEGHRPDRRRDSAIVNFMPSLQGPSPLSFHVWIHHWAAPFERAAFGFTVQVPIPAPQPTCSAVYQDFIFAEPAESFTHSRYQVDPVTAFQVYVGVDVVIVPVGEINAALPGGIALPTVNVIPSLQGP
jgi:hypothetical protein